MRKIAILMLATMCISGFAQNNSSNTNELREKLFQRFIREMENTEFSREGVAREREPNYTNLMRQSFDMIIVDPTFGLKWDEVPAPTLTNSAAMDPVLNFIRTNGWNMKSDDIFGEMQPSPFPMKPIRGLPWTAINQREFRGITSDGILYVLLTGWHHNFRGVAYNPKTNAFNGRLAGFMPIGQHWYCWVTSDDANTTLQQYEGREPSLHPWTEFSATMLTNTDAMEPVLAFIKSNGWNMATSELFGKSTATSHMKSIRGLPWRYLEDGDFDAITSNGILYVVLRGWNRRFDGIAYNPGTNAFISSICFKPIGMHWYIWVSGENVLPFIQEYEGGRPNIGLPSTSKSKK